MDKNFDVDEIEENIEHSSEDEKVSIKSSLSQTLGRTIGNKKDKSQLHSTINGETQINLLHLRKSLRNKGLAADSANATLENLRPGKATEL